MATIIHPTAEVSEKAKIGNDVRIWHQAQVREHAEIGDNCILSKGVYVDSGVKIGRNCKLQNRASVYHGVTIEDGVFVGPHVCFTNDLQPRAITTTGELKTDSDWKEAKTLIRRGASIGAHSVIVAGNTVGEWAMIGSGSVVTHDIPPHALAFGNPARIRGYVCACGAKLTGDAAFKGETKCESCGTSVRVGGS